MTTAEFIISLHNFSFSEITSLGVQCWAVEQMQMGRCLSSPCTCLQTSLHSLEGKIDTVLMTLGMYRSIMCGRQA